MDIHASRKAVEELNSLYAEMNGYKVEPPQEKLKTDRDMFSIPKGERDAAKERVLAKTKAKRLAKEGLDPVGKEDSDVDNDGDSDKSDKYLMKRRKAIGKAIAKKGVKEDVEEVEEKAQNCWDTHKKVGMKMKGGKLVNNCVPKNESFSDWRSDLTEISGRDGKEEEKQIKEKNVKNKITIDPHLKLENIVQELGGEVLELIELDEETYEMIKEAVYGGTPPEKKDTRMVVTNADKKANTPAYQKMKAGDKRYKSADHMGEDVEVDEAMSSYDRNRKRAAQRAADRNAARAAGKTGVVPGVGYVTPRKEKETYTDEKGTVRHKSGAKNEEVEFDEGMKPLPKNKMFRKAGNLGREVVSPSVTDDQRQKAYDRSKKIVKTLNKANEEVEAEGYEPMTPERKLRVDRAKRGAYDKDQRAQHQGDKKEADKQFKRRMAMDSRTKMRKEETEDSLKDRRMERGGVDGNNRYNKAPGKPNTFGKKPGQKYDGMSALDKVKASIRAKHGQGAIMDTKKK